MINFWQTLTKPFFALAPMEDVTDTVFRELIASISGQGRLRAVFTEFMSVDGFLHEKGRSQVQHRLVVSDAERSVLNEKGIKIVAQIWGSEPEKFYRTARDISLNHNFDGIDINMGCPVKKIIKHNACSGLINVPDVAKEIVLATKEGSSLPVSVKTRIGFNSVITEDWIGQLLSVAPAAITIHGRTQKMQSEGIADWNEVKKAVSIRNRISPSTSIIGNGDVLSYGEGLERYEKYHADGVMVGRGIFHNPAFFADNPDTNHERRLNLLKNHLQQFDAFWGNGKNYAILKRFFKIYIHSFEGASEMRAKLMETKNCKQALDILKK